MGRLATLVAIALSGKDKPGFSPRKLSNIRVRIINASKINLNAKKIREKEYVSYTGYPGGLKKASLGAKIKKFSFQGPLKHAIRGMLPSNKLRDPRLMNLSIEN